MHWHARGIHQNCTPTPLDALACNSYSMHQDRICAYFFFFKQTCARAVPHLLHRMHLACARIHQDCIGTLPGALACACIHQDCILTLPLLDALVRV